MHDDDGQPSIALYRDRVQQRVLSELLGLCKGMICDGTVNEAEAGGLRRWVAGNTAMLREYPGSVLAERLERIYADGRVDPEEQRELSDFLLDLTGETAEREQPMNLSTRLPLDVPPPPVLFQGQEYVFTGKMLYGTRRRCEEVATARGATVHNTVTKRTNYLVVGPIASAAWLESTHGRKILSAVELRASGHPIRIVAEEHWIRHLQ